MERCWFVRLYLSPMNIQTSWLSVMRIKPSDSKWGSWKQVTREKKSALSWENSHLLFMSFGHGPFISPIISQLQDTDSMSFAKIMLLLLALHMAYKACLTSTLTNTFLTYAGGMGLIQVVSFITVADIALSCVVTNPVAANIRVDLALIYLWARRETGEH